MHTSVHNKFLNTLHPTRICNHSPSDNCDVCLSAMQWERERELHSAVPSRKVHCTVSECKRPWQESSPVYTIQPVVKPVWQPVVSCKRGLTLVTLSFDNRFDKRLYRVYSRLSNRVDNRFDNQLYGVNGVSRCEKYYIRREGAIMFERKQLNEDRMDLSCRNWKTYHASDSDSWIYEWAANKTKNPDDWAINCLNRKRCVPSSR